MHTGSDTPETGARVSTLADADPAAQMLAERNYQISRLRTFLRWLLIFVIGFGLLQIVFAIFSPTFSGVVAAIISVIHALLLITAWISLQRQRPFASVILIGVGFALVALFGVFGIPAALPAYILFPVLSATVALPFLGRRGLRNAAWIVTAAITIIALLGINGQGLLANSLQPLLLVVAVAAIGGLTMFLLEQLHRRLTESLERSVAANAIIEQARSNLEHEVALRTRDLNTALEELTRRSADQEALLIEIQQQRAAIREMSVPVLPISATTLVMPLIGALDSGRLHEMQSQALRAVEHSQARTLLIDITGVPVVDTHVAQGLLGVMHAARLMGVKTVLVGIRPEVAQTIVGLGVEMQGLKTYADLQSALRNS